MTVEAQTESSQQDSETTLSQPTDSCWCGGTGGDFTRVIPSFVDNEEPILIFSRTCVCDKGLAEAERKRNALSNHDEGRKQYALNHLWESAQIPRRFEDWRLETSPVERIIVNLLRDSISRSEENASWFVWGNYGNGKTGLAVGYAFEYLRIWLDVIPTALFRTLPDLLSELRSSYGRGDDGPDEMDLLKTYAEVGLLILDDIGAEQITGSGWLEDRLYQIIGKRHSELRPIFFTSNLSIPQLAERIGERLTWRIVEMCTDSHIIEVKGANLRDVKRKNVL